MNALKRKFSILISEDDPDFQFLYKVAIAEVNPDIEINVVYTGAQVLQFLTRDKLQRELNRQVLPNLIITHLKDPFFSLPDLMSIRAFEKFYNIPVVLLVDDLNTAFSEKCMEAGANIVAKKPFTYLGLKTFLESLIASHQPKRLTKGLFCCRCEDFIEYDNERGHFANQIKLSAEERSFIKAKFQASLCIPCINQLKTSFRIIKGDYEGGKPILKGRN